jgi:hypothetical protein
MATSTNREHWSHPPAVHPARPPVYDSPYERREGPPPTYATPSPYQPRGPPPDHHYYYPQQQQQQQHPHASRGPPRPSGWSHGGGGGEPYESYAGGPAAYRGSSAATYGAPSRRAAYPHVPVRPPRPHDFAPPLSRSGWRPPVATERHVRANTNPPHKSPPKARDTGCANASASASTNRVSSRTKKKDADPLALLAKVSSTMEDDEDKEEVKEGSPTSPLQRRSQEVPVATATPKSDPSTYVPRQPAYTYGPKPITPTGNYSPYDDAPQYHHHRGPAYPPPQTRGSLPPHPYPPPSYLPHARVGPTEWDTGRPVMVERTSFDSHDSGDYSRGAPPRYYYDGPDYGPSSPPQHYYARSGSYPPSYGGPPPQWGYEGPPSHAPFYPPRGPPTAHGGLYERPGPERDAPPPPYQSSTAAPYTYVQQPTLEEKTVLRKKFSWKHYPEVRFAAITYRSFSLLECEGTLLTPCACLCYLFLGTTAGTILDLASRRVFGTFQ